MMTEPQYKEKIGTHVQLPSNYDEVKALQNREWPCPECDTGEIQQIGLTKPNGITNYECSVCGYSVSYP